LDEYEFLVRIQSRRERCHSTRAEDTQRHSKPSTCTPAKVGQSKEWSQIVTTVQ